MKGLLLIILSSIFFISGCCSAQLTRFNDGNYYYTDWCEYDTCWSQPNGEAVCYKNNEFVARLKAWTMEEVHAYNQMMLQQEIAQQNLLLSIQNASNQIQQTTNQMNQQTQRQIESIQRMNQQFSEDINRIQRENDNFYNNNNMYDKRNIFIYKPVIK